jgi:hypothetical protein
MSIAEVGKKAAVEAVVLTVTMAVVVLSNVSEVGETEHDDNAGTPVQASMTV